MKPILSRAVTAAAIFSLVSMVPSAQAAMVQFGVEEFTGDQMDWTVKLSDGTDSSQAGYLQIDLTIDSSGGGNTGDITGLFLGLNNTFPNAIADIAAQAAATAPGPAPFALWFGDDVTDAFAGSSNACNNLNGGGGGPGAPSNQVDVGFTFNGCGSSGGLLTSTTLFLRDGLISHISTIGGRVQTVGPGPNGGGGSSKLFLGEIPDPGTPGEEIPEPATLTLMGAGLLGLVYFRRRKND